MDRTINLRAYESAESLSSYETREALLAYRESRLDRYESIVEFIRARSGDSLPASVAEMGSGSSALLYALARRGLLKKGIGVELSASRFAFAEAWKKDDGYEAVKNVNANLADVRFEDGDWDWFVVIDNTFTYLGPEDPEYPATLVAKASRALKPGGCLLLDFINYSHRKSGKDYRRWGAFAPTDPYSYGLYSERIVDGVNVCESIFLKRDGSESRKTDISQTYTLAEVAALVAPGGFLMEEALSTFDGEAFDPAGSKRLVVLCRKNTP